MDDVKMTTEAQRLRAADLAALADKAREARRASMAELDVDVGGSMLIGPGCGAHLDERRGFVRVSVPEVRGDRARFALALQRLLVANRCVIIGVSSSFARYEDVWQIACPMLPRHGDTRNGTEVTCVGTTDEGLRAAPQRDACYSDGEGFVWIWLEVDGVPLGAAMP